jgi:hypothetical protein
MDASFDDQHAAARAEYANPQGVPWTPLSRYGVSGATNLLNVPAEQQQ